MQLRLTHRLGKWIGALAAVAREADLAPADARRRAEEAVARIQGALVLSAGLKRPKLFRRTLKDLPRLLLDP